MIVQIPLITHAEQKISMLLTGLVICFGRGRACSGQHIFLMLGLEFCVINFENTVCVLLKFTIIFIKSKGDNASDDF